MTRRRARMLTVVGASVLAAVLLLALAVDVALNRHAWAVRTLDEIEPRHARLQGLVQARPTLEQLREQQARKLAQYAYSSRDGGQATTLLQQRVRELATGAGLDVVSIQGLPARADEGFEVLQVSISVTGPIEAIQGLLIGLATSQPALHVDTATLGLGQVRRADAVQGAELIARLVLSAYRAGE